MNNYYYNANQVPAPGVMQMPQPGMPMAGPMGIAGPMGMAGPTGGGQPTRSSFACISLDERDRLRLIRFPHQEVQDVRSAIQHSWRKGIQDEKQFHGAHEFKLKGNPWDGEGSEAVPSRLLTCAILQTLWNKGWVLVAPTDISKKELDTDTLFFRQQIPPPAPCQWFTISFVRQDRLRLVGAPQDIIEPFKRTLSHQTQRTEFKDGAFEFDLKGSPWAATGAESVTARMMLLSVLETLEAHGFTLYTSFDQNTGKGRSGDTDTWFCRRPLGWVPGQYVHVHH